MYKAIGVGIGHVATGLVVIIVLRLIDINISPAVVAGIMAAMVIPASYHAYNMGKKDGMSAAQEVEQDRTDRGEES